jgi:hypothetical protein
MACFLEAVKKTGKNLTVGDFPNPIDEIVSLRFRSERQQNTLPEDGEDLAADVRMEISSEKDECDVGGQNFPELAMCDVQMVSEHSQI